MNLLWFQTKGYGSKYLMSKPEAWELVVNNRKLAWDRRRRIASKEAARAEAEAEALESRRLSRVHNQIKAAQRLEALRADWEEEKEFDNQTQDTQAWVPESIWLERHGSVAVRLDEAQCAVCFSALNGPNTVRFPHGACGCNVCRSCYLTHVQTRIDDGKLIIRCPVGCRRKLEHEHLLFLLTGNVCARTACTESSLYKKFVLSTQLNFSTRLSLMSVTELQSWEDSKLCQPCPVCSCLIGRSEGCDHMICKCGTDFCYRCGGLLHEPVPSVKDCGCTYEEQYRDERVYASRDSEQVEIIFGFTPGLLEFDWAKSSNEFRRKHSSKKHKGNKRGKRHTKHRSISRHTKRMSSGNETPIEWMEDLE